MVDKGRKKQAVFRLSEEKRRVDPPRHQAQGFVGYYIGMYNCIYDTNTLTNKKPKTPKP